MIRRSSLNKVDTIEVRSNDSRAYFQGSADDFKVSKILPMVVHGSMAIPSWASQFHDIVTQFASDRDVAATQAAFVLAAEDAEYPQ